MFVSILKICLYLITVSLYIAGAIYANEQLNDIRKVVSAREYHLRGELVNIAISPVNPDIISFESIEDGNLHRLWWFDLDSQDLVQITPRTVSNNEFFWYAQSDRDINWCPVKINGKNWFLFVSSGIEGEENIYLGNTQDNYFLRLTSGRYVDHHPRWSPDGESFVYVSSRSGNGDIYLVNNVRELIERFEQEIDERPEFREIVIEEISSGRHHIRITDNPGMDSFPDWSPDGRYIVYQGLIRSDDILNLDLFLLDMKNISAPPVNITENPEHDAIQPKWSYDRQSIAYYVSPAGRGGDIPATVHLAYIDMESDTVTGEIISFSGKGTIDANIRRNNNTGPLWGPGSRSLLYVKSEGNFTPVLMYRLSQCNDTTNVSTLRESRLDIIHREIAGYISPENALVAYLTYEEQDYRIYTARPCGGALIRKSYDVYISPEVSTNSY